MGVKLEVNLPNMDKGTELDVGGVLVKNGGSVELTDEQELGFVSRHRKSVKEWAEGSEYVKATGTGKVTPKEVENMFPEPAPAVVPEPPQPEDAEEGDKS